MSSWIEAVVNRGTDGQIEWIMQWAALNGRAGSGAPGPREPTYTLAQFGRCLCVYVPERETDRVGLKYIYCRYEDGREEGLEQSRLGASRWDRCWAILESIGTVHQDAFLHSWHLGLAWVSLPGRPGQWACTSLVANGAGAALPFKWCGALKHS